MANKKPVLPPLAEQGVDLINEDDGGLYVASYTEQRLE